jgi:hypothetical protein
LFGALLRFSLFGRITGIYYTSSCTTDMAICGSAKNATLHRGDMSVESSPPASKGGCAYCTGYVRSKCGYLDNSAARIFLRLGFLDGLQQQIDCNSFHRTVH